MVVSRDETERLTSRHEEKTVTTTTTKPAAPPTEPAKPAKAAAPAKKTTTRKAPRKATAANPAPVTVRHVAPTKAKTTKAAPAKKAAAAKKAPARKPAKAAKAASGKSAPATTAFAKAAVMPKADVFTRIREIRHLLRDLDQLMRDDSFGSPAVPALLAEVDGTSALLAEFHGQFAAHAKS